MRGRGWEGRGCPLGSPRSSPPLVHMLDCQGPIGSIRPTGTPKFDRATFPFEDQQGDSGWERPGEGMAHVPSKCRQPTHGGMESPPIPWIGKEIPFRKEGQDPSGSQGQPCLPIRPLRAPSSIHPAQRIASECPPTSPCFASSTGPGTYPLRLTSTGTGILLAPIRMVDTCHQRRARSYHSALKKRDDTAT